MYSDEREGKTMRIVLILFSFFVASTGQATQVLTCSTGPLRGTAVLDIQPAQNQTVQILVKWHDADSNTDLTGSFDAQVNSENGGLIGHGSLGGSLAGIQGAMRSDGGGIQLSISSRDHRIDWGYGLHLGCQPRMLSSLEDTGQSCEPSCGGYPGNRCCLSSDCQMTCGL